MVDDGRESEGGDSEQGEADGVDIGISIAALEDKIVQGATVMVLNATVAASSTGTIGKLSSKRPERCPAHLLALSKSTWSASRGGSRRNLTLTNSNYD
jgi:hypothetical protein